MCELFRGTAGERLAPDVGNSPSRDRVIDGTPIRGPNGFTTSGRKLEGVHHRATLHRSNIHLGARAHIVRILPMVEDQVGVRGERGKPDQAAGRRNGQELRLYTSTARNQIKAVWVITDIRNPLSVRRTMRKSSKPSCRYLNGVAAVGIDAPNIDLFVFGGLIHDMLAVAATEGEENVSLTACDQSGIAAIGSDGIDLAAFRGVSKVILTEKRYKANGRAPRGNLPGFRRITIGEKPQIRTAIVFDGHKRRAVPGEIEPLQAVVCEIVGEPMRLAARVGNCVKLASTVGTAFRNGDQQPSTVRKPNGLAEILASGVQQTRCSIVRRNGVKALLIVWLVEQID